MFRLLALLCAGAYVYNLGLTAAATPANASVQQQPVAVVQKKNNQPSLLSAVAQSGGVWLARQVHEQTAWADEGQAAGRAAPVYDAQPAYDTQARGAQANGIDAAMAQVAQRAAPAEAAPRRLRIEFAPSIAAAAAGFTR